MKRFIAALAVSLVAFPAAALAAPGDLRGTQRLPSGSLGIPPSVATPEVARHAPRTAPHRPAIDIPAPAPATATSAGGNDIDWNDAALGAGVAVVLVGISLAGVLTLRRREHPSTLAG